MFTKLRNRLTLVFIILTLVPMLAISFVLGRSIYSAAIEEALNTENLIADQLGLIVTNEIDKHVDELLLLGEAVQLNELTANEQRGVTGSILTANQSYNNIIVIDPDGQAQSEVALFDVVSNDNLDNYSQDSLFLQTVEAGVVNYSEVFFDELTGEPLLTISVPFFDKRSNELAYVIFANFRFRVIWNLVANIERQSSSNIELFLTDPTGNVIAHANPTYVFQRATYEAPENDNFGIGLNGMEALITSRSLTINNLEFTIVGQEELNTALLEARNAVINAAFIVALATVFTILFAFLVAYRITHPIEELAGIADEIREGNLNAKAKVNRSDEIGNMARAFNSMTAELQGTLAGLEKNVKELEMARRLAEENSRLKSEFLATMSHELRTPMNAIEGFTGIMLNNMAGTEYNDKTERYLNKVQSNSRRLLGLINDFLDLSRIESGRLELAHHAMSPKEVAKKWEDNLSVLADTKGLKLTVTVDPNLPETIFGDEESLSKIAINLLGNAIKFTAEGSVSLAFEKRDDQITIKVKDTGIGIPPHAREFVFDEFRQVDQSSKREYGGTGLGLAIVQKLVREMGGVVTLESEVGVGSTFTVLLPMYTEQKQVT